MIVKGWRRIPRPFNRKVTGYFGLATLFFALSFSTVVVIHHYFSDKGLWIPPGMLAPGVIGRLALLLVLYFLADGLRLYCVIRALGFRIAFSYLMKLVFVNIFISNVTPLATGGGVIQVYFMNRQGMPIGEATAATSIRTMLAAFILFTLAPIIIWAKLNQFHVFFRQTLLYGITVVSCVYLTVVWIILFRIRIIKRWIFSFTR